MRLILTRHAESEANAQGIRQGQKYDTGLSENGLKQAKKLAQRLKDEKVEAIYSSDLKRAMETAYEIAKYHSVEVIPDKRLREFDAGELVDMKEGMVYWTKYKMKDSKRLNVKPWEVKTPGGESEKDHMNRVKSFFDGIKHKGTVIIVSHGGTNKIFFGVTGLIDKDNVYTIKQHNTSVNVMELRDGKMHLLHENDIGHLEADKKLIEIFEKVQKIPYRVCKFDENEINENIKCGDCRHKSALLYNLLTKEGCKVKKVIVIFDWKDLPIPRRILSILKESTTLWEHRIVRVKVHGESLYVDPTWPLELEKLGFPVTKNWNGLEDTKQVTEGKIEFHDLENYKRPEKIVWDKEEAHKFAEKLNEWMKSG